MSEAKPRHAFVLLVAALTCLTSCASTQEKRARKVALAAERLEHLTKYQEIECQVRVRLSEPTKTAWLKALKLERRREAAGFFEPLESRQSGWRFTPYRCTMTPSRDSLSPAQQKVATDTDAKLQNVLCLWLQGFYSDSPLRGWAQNSGELVEDQGHLFLKKGERRGLEIRESGAEIRALLGGASYLSGVYGPIDGKLYPSRIEQVSPAGVGRLDEIQYVAENGRQLVQSLWMSLSVANKSEPRAYLRMEVENCRVQSK